MPGKAIATHLNGRPISLIVRIRLTAFHEVGERTTQNLPRPRCRYLVKGADCLAILRGREEAAAGRSHDAEQHARGPGPHRSAASMTVVEAKKCSVRLELTNKPVRRGCAKELQKWCIGLQLPRPCANARTVRDCIIQAADQAHSRRTSFSKPSSLPYPRLQ